MNGENALQARIGGLAGEAGDDALQQFAGRINGLVAGAIDTELGL